MADRIVINYNEIEDGDLKARLINLENTKETYFSNRSHSETARIVLKKGLDIVEKELADEGKL